MDGTSLPDRSSRDAYDEAVHGWHYDAGDRFGVIHIKAGRIDTRAPHRLVVEIDPTAEPTATGDYPVKPIGSAGIDPDALMVVSRSAEEPGHPLENAFDGDLDTALKYSQRSIEMAPEYGGYLDTLAHVHFARGEYEKAVQVQTKAAELDPHSGLIARQLRVFTAKLEETKREKKREREAVLHKNRLLKATQEYIDKLYYRDMYDALACWRTTKSVDFELKELKSDRAKKDALKEQIRIR